MYQRPPDLHHDCMITATIRRPLGKLTQRSRGPSSSFIAHERPTPRVVRSQRSQNETTASRCWRPFDLVRATFFSSGDRIRTCDLWVMSEPVAVSPSAVGLKSPCQRRSAVPPVSRRRACSHRFHCVLFPNPFPTRQPAAAVASTRRLGSHLVTTDRHRPLPRREPGLVPNAPPSSDGTTTTAERVRLVARARAHAGRHQRDCHLDP
jgi:hypothetical protein